MARIWTFAALVALSLLALFANASEPGAGQTTDRLRIAGTKEARVRVQWTSRATGKERTARVTLRTAELEKPIEIYKGKSVRADVAARGDVVLVAMIHGGSTPLIRFAVVDLSATPKVVTIKVPRPADDQRRPASIVATSDDKGFTVLWQEESTRDANADVRTYFSRVTPAGALSQKPTRVEVPWAIAALAYNGKGYHLALYYDGMQPGQTRVAMVTLSPQAAPEQHPWWASAPGDISDVQLVRAGGKVVAFYRGGASSDRLESTDVTAVGQWGQEPAAATSHGTIAEGESYALKVARSGKISVVRRAADTF